ncbi:MAG: MogA/MoaB family molybdenum cofactor biosynthesis protein [Eubacteriaceae bacterium]|nr:MogA/MoaB family molybdenum cofactor biosynthesis protein [Eubacteriaceae bacterium]
MYRVYVITSSDSASRGEREDLSGPEIKRMLEEFGGYEVVGSAVLPDDRDVLANEMMRVADEKAADLILTTGGTGFSQRDNMPEATMDACTRMVPGIAEAMRAYSMTKTPRGMLSRAASGIRGFTLIINLPGSVKAVRECLECVLPALDHGLDILRGDAAMCGESE